MSDDSDGGDDDSDDSDDSDGGDYYSDGGDDDDDSDDREGDRMSGHREGDRISKDVRGCQAIQVQQIIQMAHLVEQTYVRHPLGDLPLYDLVHHLLRGFLPLASAHL